MVKRTVTKSLIVMEDIAQGKGQISQTRAGLPTDVHKVDVYYAVDSEAEMTALDITKFNRVSIYSAETAFINYIFDSTAIAGIAPDVGTGFWIVVKDTLIANYQSLRDYTGVTISLWVQGQVTHADGGESFFQLVTGAAPGFYVNDDETIIVPTGGDGSAAWIKDGSTAKHIDRLNPATLAIWQNDTSAQLNDVVTTAEFSTGNGGGAKYDTVTGETPNPYDIIAHGTLSLQLKLRTSHKTIILEKFGLLKDGSDNTAMLEFVTNKYTKAEFAWFDGTFSTQTVKLSTKQTLSGPGYGGEIFQLANSTDDLIQTRNPATDVEITIKNFKIDGNKANQTATNAGINLDATGMASPTLVRHNLSGLIIIGCKGRGLVHPFPGRDSTYDNVVIYQCDEQGLHLLGSDSQLNNFNIGQSGFQGVFDNGGSANQLTNMKSWFNGRLDSSQGQGYHFRNANGLMGSNLNSQENEAQGFLLDGATAPLLGVILETITSNADNKSLTTFDAIDLLNVDGARISAKVWKSAALAGLVNDALKIRSDTLNCQISVNADSSGFSSLILDGDAAAIGNNDIRLNNRATNIDERTGVTGNLIYDILKFSTLDLSLTGNTTLQNPTRLYPGMEIQLIIRQDATGRTFSFDTNYAGDLTVSTTPNAIIVKNCTVSRAGDIVVS